MQLIVELELDVGLEGFEGAVVLLADHGQRQFVGFWGLGGGGGLGG